MSDTKDTTTDKGNPPDNVPTHKWIEVRCAWDDRRRLMRLMNPNQGPPKPPFGIAQGVVEVDGAPIEGKAHTLPDRSTMFFADKDMPQGDSGSTKAG